MTLVVKRYLFTFKHPTNIVFIGGLVSMSVNKMADAAFSKLQRDSKKEELPEPRETKAPGILLIEFYGEPGLLLDLEARLRLEMVKNRRLSPYINKLDLLKQIGVEWSFEELEEWKSKEVDKNG